MFAGTLFVSALLLFVVQPMFAKMVLPRLGGSPAVWSVAMCFFQVTLLAGYAYAHGLARVKRTPHRVVIHMCVLLAASFLLPLGIAAGWERPPEDGLSLWVLGLFAASIGLPFFALSANAPLLQAWFARTGHPHAQDPYFLYGSSNLGSLLALLAYPLAIEPYLTLGTQSQVWSLAFKVLIVLVGFSGVFMLLRRSAQPAMAAQAAAGEARQAGVTMGDRLAWIGLAFVPSGLLVAVTSHISTDVAAAPFLWVLPLALFLLTFVITFQQRPILSHRAMLAVQPATAALLVVSLQFPLNGYWLGLLGLHLLAFFVNAMVCHGELVRRRPHAAHLTEFYLYMSLGGALGGLFTGLLAPHIFSTVLEYPLMIVLALAARPGVLPLKAERLVKDVGFAAILLAIAAGPKLLMGIEIAEHAPWFYISAFTAFGLFMIMARPAPVRLAALAVATLMAGHVLIPDYTKGESHRGFFGVNKVIVTPDQKFRLLTHGTTLHGAQRLGADVAGRPPEPLSYFHLTSPFAELFRSVREVRQMTRVAVTGLGAGTLACYRQPGERWTFFEIDPIVVRLARDPKNFRYLSDCAPEAKMVVGDARLTLAEAPDKHFDLIVLDAFSSDSVPVHLLTREAIAMYLSKLTPNGVLMFNVSNRNMDLIPVVAALADHLGLVAFGKRGPDMGPLEESYKTVARVVVMARSEADFGPLRARGGWDPLEHRGWTVWSDDYSNILKAIWAAFRSTPPKAPAQ